MGSKAKSPKEKKEESAKCRQGAQPPPRNQPPVNEDLMDYEDSSDEETPNKRPKNLRQSVTRAYEKKLQETKEKRIKDGTLVAREEVDFVVKEGRSLVPESVTKAPDPITREKAPTIKVRDLIPGQVTEEELGEVNDTFKASRIEFLVLAKKALEEDHEWTIPEDKTFEKAMLQAITAFTKEDYDKLDCLEYSAMGWNTGLGLVAFRADSEELMEEFRGLLRAVRLDGLRFETFPRKMLVTQFALTIYFNSAFETLSPEILLYWLKRYNPTLRGSITVVSVKAYPPGHARHGARIVAFEGDQDFLDSLYR
jgi:hypothetical protein